MRLGSRDPQTAPRRFFRFAPTTIAALWCPIAALWCPIAALWCLAATTSAGLDLDLETELAKLRGPIGDYDLLRVAVNRDGHLRAAHNLASCAPRAGGGGLALQDNLHLLPLKTVGRELEAEMDQVVDKNRFLDLQVAQPQTRAGRSLPMPTKNSGTPLRRA